MHLGRIRCLTCRLRTLPDALQQRARQHDPDCDLKSAGQKEGQPQSTDGREKPGEQSPDRRCSPHDTTPGATDPAHQAARSEALT